MKTPKTPKTPKTGKLNVRQERFAELVASGVPATTAYRQAGYTDAGRTAEAHASRLVENGGVAARIAELRKPAQDEIRKTKAEKLKRLEEIAWSKDVRHSDAIAAIRVHNEMTGDATPSKIEVNSGPSVIESIRERAMKVASALDLNARLRERGTAARSLKVGVLSRWNPETDS